MRRPLIFLRRAGLWALCLLTVIIVRIGLQLTKFGHLQRWLCADKTHAAENEARAYVVARNIRSAARFVPRATCMTQAISGQAVLSWLGVPTEMVIGAAQAPSPGATKSGKTDFHAWLLWKEKVILGGEELETNTFVPFSTFPTAPSK